MGNIVLIVFLFFALFLLVKGRQEDLSTVREKKIRAFLVILCGPLVFYIPSFFLCAFVDPLSCEEGRGIILGIFVPVALIVTLYGVFRFSQVSRGQ